MSASHATAIADGMVVSIHYTLTDEDGTVIDTSSGGEPLEYLHGHGNIVPGLERGLKGHNEGESLRVDVPPSEGYGEHDPRGLMRVPRDSFPDDMELEPGMQFSGEDDAGEEQSIWIAAVEGDQIVIDRNHPLAGQTLHFEVTIQRVRNATREELSHGHVHGAHGHHH